MTLSEEQIEAASQTLFLALHDDPVFVYRLPARRNGRFPAHICYDLVDTAVWQASSVDMTPDPLLFEPAYGVADGKNRYTVRSKV